MESLHLSPVSLKLLHGPLADQYKEERKLTAMLRDYGFGFLTDSDPDLFDKTQKLRHMVHGVFRPDVWPEVLRTWPRTKHGCLGPTDVGEETHIDDEGKSRETAEKKCYIAVDQTGNGWHGDPEACELIQFVFRKRFQIALKVARVFENGSNLKPGTLAGLLSMDENTHSTMRINWYPPGGFSLDHTDTCALTVLDYEPGIEIEHPQGSENYVRLEGAKPGDLIINLGDTFTRVLGGVDQLSTRHRVKVPDNLSPEGRVTMPVFINTRLDACFPDGENIHDWAAAKFGAEGAAADRNV
jgi:hypothetical protein